MLWFLRDDAKAKAPHVHFDESEWKLEVVKGVPRQENGYANSVVVCIALAIMHSLFLRILCYLQTHSFDCGVFVVKMVDFLSQGLSPLDFVQADMPYFRRRLVLEIKTKRVD